jgi:hypothetical protein
MMAPCRNIQMVGLWFFAGSLSAASGTVRNCKTLTAGSIPAVATKSKVLR